MKSTVAWGCLLVLLALSCEVSGRRRCSHRGGGNRNRHGQGCHGHRPRPGRPCQHRPSPGQGSGGIGGFLGNLFGGGKPGGGKPGCGKPGGGKPGGGLIHLPGWGQHGGCGNHGHRPGPGSGNTGVNIDNGGLPDVKPASCNAKLDMLFILDSSGSIDDDDYDKETEFAAKISESFKVGRDAAQFSSILFSSRVIKRFCFNKYKSNKAVSEAILKSPHVGGQTFTAAALSYARTKIFTKRCGHRKGLPKVAVVITDGRSTQPLRTIAQALLLKKSGVIVISVGVGPQISMPELTVIASRKDLIFKVTNFDALSAIQGHITNMACKAAEEQTQEEKEDKCKVPLDLAFLVDASGSLGVRNFRREKAFVNKVVGKFTIGPKDVQVSVVTFASRVRKQFCFNKYSTSSRVTNAIKRIRYPRGKTYTGAALRYARNVIFTRRCGARDNANRLVIVVTDGKSTGPKGTIKESKLLHGTGVDVISVGVGRGVSQKELKVIASKDNLVFTSANFAKLAAITDRITTTACETAQEEPGYKEVCTGECASNLKCQVVGKSRMCLCESGFFWNKDVKGCVPLPGYREECSTECSFNMYCKKFGDKKVCVCPSGFVYDEDKIACMKIKKNHAGLDILFAIDVAGNVGKSDYHMEIDFMLKITHAFHMGIKDVQFGALLFASKITKLFQFGQVSTYAQISKILLGANYGQGGKCQIGNAFQYAWGKFFTPAFGARPNFHKLVVLLTDGQANNQNLALKQSQILKSLGINVVIIGIGNGINKPQLEQCVTRPDYLITVPGFGDLVDVVDPLITICLGIDKLPGYDELCSDKCAFNLACLDLGGGYRCACEKGHYWVPKKSACRPLPGYDEKCSGACSSNYRCVNKKCQCHLGFTHDAKKDKCVLKKKCDKKVDLLFLIDSSGSLGKDNFRKELYFMSSLSKSFSVSGSGAQISAALFSTEVYNQFCFNKYSSNDKIAKALTSLPYKQGVTMTGKALEYARTSAFTKKCGSRSGANKVVVVITDGQSTRPEETAEQAELLKQQAVQVISVGVGSGISKDELKVIATSDDQVFTANDFQNLNKIQEAVLTSACQASEAVPGYNDFCTGKCQQGLECLDAGGQKKCLCKVGFFFDLVNQKCLELPDYKEPCSSQCLYDLKCLPSGGKQLCLCLEDFYFDKEENECTPIPEYHEPCKKICASNLKCLNLNGVKQCDCPTGMHYDTELKKCAKIPTYGESCKSKCAFDLVCQKINNGMQCRCRAGHYWIKDKQQCKKIPGYQEACSGVCQPPLSCLEGACDCKAGFYYDSSDNKCHKVPGHGQPCLGVCSGNLQCKAAGDKQKCQCPGGFSWDSGKGECVLVEKCTTPVDLMFAIDASGSLGIGNFKQELDFVNKIVANFPVSKTGSRVAAFTFSTQVNPLFCFDKHDTNDAVQKAISSAPYTKGVTMTNLALDYARTQGFTDSCGARNGAKELLIVVTDGKSTRPHETIKAALMLHVTGATVVSIGIGNGISATELEVIASDPNLAFAASDFSALDGINAQVTELACEAAAADPEFGEECTDKCSSNYKCLEDNGVKKCRCPGGYFYHSTIMACAKIPNYDESCVGRCASNLVCTGGKCKCPGKLAWDTGSQKCLLVEPCKVPLDLLFVVDSSGSLGETNFKKELKFVQKIVDSFEVGPQGTQVAMLTFATFVTHQFCFKDHSTKQAIKAAVESTDYTRGVTMTNLAMQAARTNYYTPSCGSRPNAAKVTVVITDGKSTIPQNTIDEAPKLHAYGVKVVSIGIGHGISQDELKVIASSPDLVFSAENFNVLDAIQKEVSSTACEAAEAVPSYKEGCSETCDSNLECTLSGTEEICLCSKTHYWDSNSRSCVAIKCLSGCNVCGDKPDGDFPACFPECGAGFFYNCLNGHTEIGYCMNGQLEIALHPGQSTTEMPGVSNTERCTRLEAFCPR